MVGWIPRDRWKPSAKEREECERIQDELEKDAARYRWLRDKAPVGIGDMASVRSSHGSEEIDAAIDAAIQKETE